jgi:hypothetical protein
MTSGMDLKVERVKARASATAIAEQMGVVRQRISQIEALAIVPDDTVERYRTALLSVTEGAQNPRAVA